MKFFKYFVMVILTLFSDLFATTYYVDALNGNDVNNGLTSSSPWKTISKINNRSFLVGDQILLKKGSIWREQLNIPSNGLIIGTYGTGNEPKILGSVRLSNWTYSSTNIWKSYISVNPTWVWFLTSTDTIVGNKKADVSTLSSMYDFTFSSNYIYIYSATDPNMNSLVGEAAIRDNGIYGYRKDNVSINGISFLFTKRSAIYLGPGNYWNISNVTGCYSGDYINESPGDGILCYGSNNIIRDSKFYQNAHAGINIYDVAGNSANNIVEKNIIYNNYHNNIDIKTLNVANVENCIVRYNRIFCTNDFLRTDVAGIFLQGNTSTYVNGISIYYNIISNQTGSGIHLSTNTNNINIFNNTVFKTRYDNTACYYVYNGTGSIILKNNIGMDAKTWILRLELTTNKTIDNNCWYQETGLSQSIARIGSSSYSNWDTYKTITQFDLNSINQNPLFDNAYVAGFNLQSISPAINKGINVGLSTDYYSKFLSENPDMGAAEYIVTDATAPKIISANLVSSTSINLLFSEKISAAEAQTASNYLISNGIIVSNAALNTDQTTVTLTTSQHTETQTNTITVLNIKDLAGNIIASPGNTIQYTFNKPENTISTLLLYAENGLLANGAALKLKAGSKGSKVAWCSSLSSTIKFTINIPTSGTWYIWGRFFFEGQNNDPNSFFISVDKGTKYIFGNNKDYFNQWNWEGNGSVQHGTSRVLLLGNLSAGSHTLIVSGREPGQSDMIDMICLTNDPKLVASDINLNLLKEINSLGAEEVVSRYELLQNYPNPFNPSTKIMYNLAEDSFISLKIFDILGKEVTTLVNESQNKGTHEIIFNAQYLPSGIYIYQLKSNKFLLTKKMQLVR